MRLEIRSHDLEFDQELRDSIESRIRFVLARSSNRITRVTVFLSDINGPRGGIDKRCRIVVRLVPAGQVFVEDTDTDLGVVVDRAMDRVGQSVRRELERQRERGLTGEYSLPSGDL